MAVWLDRLLALLSQEGEKILDGVFFRPKISSEICNRGLGGE